MESAFIPRQRHHRTMCRDAQLIDATNIYGHMIFCLYGSNGMTYHLGMRPRDIFAATLVSVIWGLAFVATKIGLDGIVRVNWLERPGEVP